MHDVKVHIVRSACIHRTVHGYSYGHGHPCEVNAYIYYKLYRGCVVHILNNVIHAYS